MGAALPILSVGMSVVTAFAQMGVAKQQYAAQVDAATRQATAQYAEVQRQEGEVNRIAQEQASDRVRNANAELGTVRVMALERGVSGTTMTAFARTIGYLEGMDLSRIDKNRKANIDAGEAAKLNAKNGYIDTVTIAGNQLQASNISATLGAIGSGLQIAGNQAQNTAYLNALKNTKV